MAQTMVNFRMDADLKKDMENTCKDMGLTVSAAFILFAKKVTQERRIPFEIVADPFYSFRISRVCPLRKNEQIIHNSAIRRILA